MNSVNSSEKKNAAEMAIEALHDVFNIATDGFEEFHKNASKSSSMGNSTSASSGDESTSASSGYRSTSASSGDYSKSASSGDESTSASSGYRSTSASSGDYSKSASSGDYSKSASSGDYSKSASSGDNSASASSGYRSKSVSSGSGSASASSGYRSTSASSGDNSACSALGYRAAVKGDIGNLIMASEYIKTEDGQYKPVGGKVDIIDGKLLKPDCWYIVENGEWVEVDLSDNIFSYVLSSKGDIKKVRIESGEVFYVATDGKGTFAHGKTIRQAQEDLIYKKTVDFDGTVPKEATGEEWVSIYRQVTGACSAGLKAFVEASSKDLKETYTKEEIVELSRNQFGHETFKQY